MQYRSHDEMLVCKQAIYHGSGAKQKSKQHGTLGRSYYCNMIIVRSECTKKWFFSNHVARGINTVYIWPTAS